MCRTYVPVVRAYGTNTLGFLTSAVAGCVFCSPTVGTRLALVFRKPAVARRQPDRAGRAGKRRISGLLSEPLRWGPPGSFRRADGLRVIGTGGGEGGLRFFCYSTIELLVEWGFEPQTRILYCCMSLWKSSSTTQPGTRGIIPWQGTRMQTAGHKDGIVQRKLWVVVGEPSSMHHGLNQTNAARI